MRLSKHQAVIATQELLSILAQHPQGMRTSELSGTPKFHEARTLNNRHGAGWGSSLLGVL